MKAEELIIGKVYRVYIEFKILLNRPTIDRKYIYVGSETDISGTYYKFVRHDNETYGAKDLLMCEKRVEKCIRFVKDYDYLKNHAGLNAYSLNLLDKAEKGKRRLSKSDLAGFIFQYNVHDWLSREHADIKRDEYVARFNKIYNQNFK